MEYVETHDYDDEIIAVLKCYGLESKIAMTSKSIPALFIDFSHIRTNTDSCVNSMLYSIAEIVAGYFNVAHPDVRFKIEWRNTASTFTEIVVLKSVDSSKLYDLRKQYKGWQVMVAGKGETEICELSREELIVQLANAIEKMEKIDEQMTQMTNIIKNWRNTAPK